MDPEAIYQLLVEAVEDGDQAAITEHSENLSRWIQSGGFAPVVDPRLPSGHPMQWLLAQALAAACRNQSVISQFVTEIQSNE